MRGRACLLAALALVACGREPTDDLPAPSDDGAAASPIPPVTAAWFEQVAAERGLGFRHESGHDGTRFLFPEIMGGGAALLDLDGDADLDAYLVQSGTLHADDGPPPANRLFRNRGNGHFEDVTEASGAGDVGYGMGVAAGDVENDGDLDLYVTNLGANALLVNDGAARFADRTLAAGVDDPSWSVSAAFFDADNDGDLDLFVADYVLWSPADELTCRGRFNDRPDYCSPKSYAAPAPDTLYENRGDGSFVDASSAAGLRTAFGNGLGVLCFDYDVDGLTDVYVANDGTENQLWHNQGELRFVDAGPRTGSGVDEHGTPKAGMGVAAVDWDDDGDEDLLVVNLAMESDSFYRNEGEYFTDRTSMLGLTAKSRPFTRFGCAFADFDQDGRLDLYEANGRVERPRDPPPGNAYAEPNLLFRGTPEGRLEPVPLAGASHAWVATSRAAAFGDVDGDGAIDVLVANNAGDAHLFRNVVRNRGGWIALRLLDHGRDAFGARVSLVLDGGRTITRTVRSAYSYAAASDPRVHVGLGEATLTRDVEVRWADGATERFPAPPPRAVTTLVRGTGDLAR